MGCVRRPESDEWLRLVCAEVCVGDAWGPFARRRFHDRSFYETLPKARASVLRSVDGR